MQALILAGGEGTRLRPLTLTLPKPAIPLVDRPFIRYMVEWVTAHGADEVVIASGFRAEAVREALEEGESPPASIAYVEEDEPLGTGGPLRLAADQGILAERFLCLNGDVLADLDLTKLSRMHAESSAVATLALHPVDDPTPYGLVRRAGGRGAPGDEPASEGGEVEEFVEKPGPEGAESEEISAGAYVLEHRVLDLIPRGRPVSIEREVFPQLVGRGLYGQRLEGYWMDIGTPERYLQANWDILEGRVRTRALARLGPAGILVDDDAQVDAAASVRSPAFVGAEAEIAAEAAIGGHAVVGPRSEVGTGSSVSDSVVLRDCRIGSGVSIHGSVLGPGAAVGDGAQIDEGAVIGEGARVEPGSVIGGGARLAPGEVVS
jgi:mannose-1-phosphate guanylyltransferase